MKENFFFLAFPNFWIFWIFLDFFGVKKTKHRDEPRRLQIVTMACHIAFRCWLLWRPQPQPRLWTMVKLVDSNKRRPLWKKFSWSPLIILWNHFRVCDYPKMLRFLPWAWSFILNEIRVRRLFPPTLMYQFALLSKINMLVNIKKGRKANNEVSTYIIYILYA